MTTRASRKQRRRARAWLIPTLIVLIGVSSIVLANFWSRSNQISKYALPADRSAKSMLAFLRRLDGEYDPTVTLTKQSNLPAINAAVREATQAIDADRSRLSPKEAQEANYYRLFYGYRSIMLGDRENDDELDDLLVRTRRYVDQLTRVSSKDANVAGASLVVLDLSGRTKDALQIADLIEEKFSRLPDGLHKSSVLSSLVGFRNRLQMLHTQLDWQSRSLDGSALDMSELRGKVVFVEFWSTTCGPCIADFPALKRIYSTYHDEGFEVIGVCLYASAAKIKSVTQKHQLPWLQVCHDEVDGNDQWAEQFGINAVPSTFLVDQSGRIVAFGVRPLHGNKHRDLESRLQQMLNETN